MCLSVEIMGQISVQSLADTETWSVKKWVSVLFGKSLAETAVWETSGHYSCVEIGSGKLLHSFMLFSALFWISEIVIEALKFTEHFALITYPWNCGTKIDLECTCIVFRF